MRPEGNPLDLNNLPDDQSSRDGSKQLLEDTSSPGGCGSSSRKKKNGGKDGKDVECGKVYECRFCSLKFCKSQALGGHMNRHRQERETETLNHARQLVFRNDHTVVAAQAPPPHMVGCCPPIPSAGGGGYHNHPAAAVAVGGNMGMGEPTVLPLLRFPRYFSSSSPGGSSSSGSTHMPPPPPLPSQPYLYTSPPPRPMSFSTHLIPQQQHHPLMNDYHHHVMSMSSTHQNYVHHNNINYAAAAAESNYTCIGAPVGVGQGFMASGRVLDNINCGKEQQQNQEEGVGLNWGGRNYSSSTAGGGAASLSLEHPRLDPPSAINRFQDHGGF